MRQWRGIDRGAELAWPVVSPLVCSRCIGYFRIVRYMEKVKQIHVILSRTPVSSKTDGVVH